MFFILKFESKMSGWEDLLFSQISSKNIDVHFFLSVWQLFKMIGRKALKVVRIVDNFIDFE